MSADHPLITRERYRVASWDVDACNRLRTSAMGRYMQETAETSSRSLGGGFADLARESQTWVLVGLLLEISRQPRFREQIAVETWPRDIVRRRALRDFRLRDEDGTIFAAATTAWYCLDLASRRPVSPERWRTTDWLSDLRAVDRDCDQLPAVTEPAAEIAVPVRWSDLDLNGHITDTRCSEPMTAPLIRPATGLATDPTSAAPASPGVHLPDSA